MRVISKTNVRIFSCSETICSPDCLCLRREAEQSSRSWQVSDYNYSQLMVGLSCQHCLTLSATLEHQNILNTTALSSRFTRRSQQLKYYRECYYKTVYSAQALLCSFAFYSLLKYRGGTRKHLEYLKSAQKLFKIKLLHTLTELYLYM